MLKNYLLIALRNLRKYKVYSFINIFGLSIGIASCLLILLFVQNEMTFDQFHENADHIYRLYKVEKRPVGIRSNSALPPPLAGILGDEFAEVESAVRFFKPFNDAPKLIRHNGIWLEETVHFADSDFLSIFTFPLLKGDPATALQSPNSVVLSNSIAAQLFGNDDPLGESISIRIGGKDQSFVVSGVTAPIPANSSLNFSVLLNYAKVKDELEGFFGSDVLASWNSFTETYVKVSSQTTGAELEAKMPDIVEKYSGNLVKPWRLLNEENAYQLRLQPLTDIHLQPTVRSSITATRSPVNSYILSGIALLLLVLACINFMSFSVGRSMSRAREVGMRKVMGAARSQLMRQFWGEAFLMTFLAFAIAVMLAETLLPAFNALTGVTLRVADFDPARLSLTLILLLIVTGFVAGGYPALVLSRFRPGAVLQGKTKVGGRGLFSRALVVFQFVLSIFLLVSTITMFRQLAFLQTKDLGFNEEQVIVIPTHSEGNEGGILLERYKYAVASHPVIVGMTGSDGSFGASSLRMSMHADEELSVVTYRVDTDFLRTMEISLLEGRNFEKEMPTDLSDAVLINESLKRSLQWEAPIGKQLSIGFPNKTVIGVVQDYHFESLHQGIGPILLHMNPGRPVTNIFVRIEGGQVHEALSLLEKEWQAIAPNDPFTYSFLDQTVAVHYEADRRWGQIVSYAAVLAMVISCLGLFGLASLVVAQRLREIGVRKVLGASAAGIVALVTANFSILLFTAFMVSIPLSYYAMHQWLANFAYRVNLDWWVFLLGGASALFVALVTVATQAIKAAVANPAETLRHE